MSDEAAIRDELKEVAHELRETNKLLVKVVTDNEHRDIRLDAHSEQIKELTQQFSQFREDYKPHLDRLKKTYDSKDDKVRTLGWLAAIALGLLLLNAAIKGEFNIPYLNTTQNTQKSNNNVK